MSDRSQHTRSFFVRLAGALALATLAARGGGDDDAADAGAGGGAAGGAGGAGGGGGTPALTCNTERYAAGAVELPSAAQLAAYAGTYNGDEGSFGPNPGDPFVKAASASFVLGADGSVSYKGVSYAPSSVCIEKTAGSLGRILYVVAGSGHIDVSDQVDPTLGSAWGVSLANGTTIFRKGLKP